MKTIQRVAFSAVFYCLLSVSVSGVFAQDGTITGAYGEASVTDPDVISAAKFAVKAKSQRLHTPVSLISIQHAEVQIVAGLNFDFDLKVKVRGKQQDVKAVVYRNLQNVYSLSKWDVVRRENVTAPYRITAIKAMLFYDGNGALSRDVLASPRFNFWNTIIGEGDAESPSNSTLVLVEVSGNPSRDKAAPSRHVEFTATAGRKLLLKRITRIGLFSDDGKYYAAFWLYNTGCDSVQISTRILGQALSSHTSKTIPFACGE